MCYLAVALRTVTVFQVKMVGWMFRTYGEVCASHPWEVIVSTLTLTVCMLTVDQRTMRRPLDPYKDCDTRNNCVGLEVQYTFAFYSVELAVECSVDLVEATG
jgi:hydroxymethylglutaryl-CoA reductase (NADPH)